MVNYNQPPERPNVNLEIIVANACQADLDECFDRFDNHCFDTLNRQTNHLSAFECSAALLYDEMEYIEEHNLYDLYDFVKGLKKQIHNLQ